MFVKLDGMYKAGEDGTLVPDTPSKPCTEGANDSGEHCFCVLDEERMVRRCCWCPAHKKAWKPVPGHGPYRTQLVRE